jgi:hypothetical protein
MKDIQLVAYNVVEHNKKFIQSTTWTRAWIEINSYES